MAKKVEITLDNLIAALKSEYEDKTDVPLLILRHWAKNNYDMQQATREQVSEIEKGFLKLYQQSQPLERGEARALLEVYDEHLHRTTTFTEREEIAIALGYTPVEFKIREEGFSLRELMQALKFFDGPPPQWPESILAASFERYFRLHLGRPELAARTPEAIARYRREPAMSSEECARAILKQFGLKLLDDDNPEDVQVWKKVSGAREH
jgi:hypothetical protein